MDRRVWKRPYFFEIVTIVNFLVIFALIEPANPIVLTSVPTTLKVFIPQLAIFGAIGVVVRAIIARFRGEFRAYWRVIRSPGWLVDSVRIIVCGALMVHTYFWIKLVVPLLHPVLYDQLLWNIDRAMFFGYSPNVLFLNVFSQQPVLKSIDWAYARIFFASMSIAFIFFLSAPSRRLRAAFSNGNTLLWLVGAWLYMLVPSMGPAYRFPDVWLPFVYGLDMTQAFQAMLIRNYQAVLRLPVGGSLRDVQLMYGVAAFPSLHVAFQTFVFLWMRRLWIYGEIVFGVFTLVILIGSVVTGWHYLIDGLAGMIMAIVCYLAGAATWRIREWLRVRAAIRR
ncbi:MAG TPA: phosphatase PAP2 family protein [Thermoanaerobaculia bacterium]|nr:phosphatase PAP2 family protein [Thermoanaerobaculia bacterium]